ncbi:phytanoyl-CoA dioxygenase family protein [Kitasatospora sp. NPDC058162]|uniref:phytanoyl-CoA dioxygenase family protein n=1 Tax=Kitasatospora sp. NPDC058162 TaxID=3346362 RepID=UPI0036DEB8A0
MILTDQLIESYQRDGFVLVENVIAAEDIGRLRAEAERLFALDHPGRVFEKDGKTVRGIHGCHTTGELFPRLIRLPSLLASAEQLLASKVYVHQCKINAKRALSGDTWPWHQDYIFWEQQDGLREPRVVNVALFLDEADEFNGPLLFVPGSHLQGVIRTERNGSSPDEEAPGWASSLSADLDYALGPDDVARAVGDRGIRSATGPAGSLLFFDSRIVHASGPNMSPVDRTLFLATYNSVENELADVPTPRPEFLAARDNQPLEALNEAL